MPSPREKGETEKDFISRCMCEIKGEYPDNAQRFAVCKSYADKSSQKMKQEELFVLQPRKSENRGMYLTRCSAHPKIKSQFNNLKERMGFCLNAFNEYYRYWNRLEMSEVPEDTALGQCIAKEKSKGFDYKTAYRHCASRVVVKPQGGTNPVVMEEDNLLVEPVMFSNISVDFDDTLSTKEGQDMVKKLIDEGDEIHIITRRNEKDSEEVYKVADELGIPRDHIHFTNGELKWKTIKKLGIKKHIDNNSDELKAIQDNLNDVEIIKFSEIK